MCGLIVFHMGCILGFAILIWPKYKMFWFKIYSIGRLHHYEQSRFLFIFFSNTKCFF
jgi:hypothetical protein